MANRIGIIGIVVDDPTASADEVNDVLSAFGDIIIGRLGIPYRKRGVSVISVAVDGNNDQIGALCGKLGRIKGVNAKSVLSTKIYEEDVL